MSVKVLKTNDTWYGMTYHEDVAAVKDLSLIHISPVDQLNVYRTIQDS